MNPFLAALNWILWDSWPLSVREAKLLTSVRLDLADFRSAQGLEADALAWEASGRDSDYLMADPARVRRMQSLLADAGNPVGISQRAAAFIAASLGATRLFRRRKYRRWAIRAAVAVVVVIVIVTGIAAVRRLDKAAFSDAVLGFDSTGSNDPVAALRAAGAVERLLRDGQDVPLGAFRRLTDILARPWILASLGSQWDVAVNGSVFAADGRHIYFADGRGTITLWDPDTMSTVWRRQVSAESLYWLFGSPDGRWVAAIDADDQLSLFDTEPWRRVAVLDGVSGVVSLAVDGSGSHVAYLTGSGELYAATAGSADRPRLVRHFDATYDVGRRGTAPVALVRDGDELQIMDALTGEALDRALVPGSENEAAALGPDGTTVAVAGADRQLWFGQGLGDLRPTGHALLGAVLTLAVSPLGDVVYDTVAQSGQLFDTTTGVLLGTICEASRSAERYSFSPDGRRVVCGFPPTVAVQDLDDLRPLPRTPDDADMFRSGSARGSAAGPVQSIEVQPSQLIRVSIHSDDGDVEHYLDPMGRAFNPRAADSDWPTFEEAPSFSLDPQFAGTPTVVGVDDAAGTILVGSSDGTVTELDVLDNGQLYRTSRWTTPDGGPVTAIGWSADGRRVLAETGNGNVWQGFSCRGCRRDPELVLDAIADRWLGCGTPDALTLVQDETIARLRLQPCESPPEPEE